MSSFLDNSAALGIQPLPTFGQDVGSTVFPTSISGQEVNTLETRNVVNNSATGAGLLSFLTSAAGLALQYKAIDASLKSGSAGKNIPPTTVTPTESAELTPTTKKALLYGGALLVILVVIGLFRRR